MNIPIITEGATTDHGGIVVEGVGTFKIDGKKAHVDGMSHYCPKCKKTVTAIASNHTKKINGKAFVLEGDKTTCGAKFIANQGMAFVGGGNSSIEDPKQTNQLLSNINENYNYGNKFQLIDQLTRKPLCNTGYKLICDGKITEGRTDQQGYTEFISSDTEADVQLFLINNFEEFEDGSR